MTMKLGVKVVGRSRRLVSLLIAVAIVAPIVRERLDKYTVAATVIAVLSVFLPELGDCVGFAQNTKYHTFDVYEHSIRALGFCQDNDLITRLSILLHDVGKPRCYTEDQNGGHFKGHAPIGVELTEAIMHRLRFDNATTAAVLQLVELHDRPIAAETKSVSMQNRSS